MRMTPRVQRLALTAHITVSVSWIGAVGVFLSLAIAGLTSADVGLVRSAYLVMNLTGWYVIVPLSLAALATGILQSLGTDWGLFRHYWVVLKLVLNLGATSLLLLHMRPAVQVARAAADHVVESTELRGLRLQLVGDAVTA